jgi:hypothetical protein
MVKPFVSKYPDIFRIDERRHVMSKDFVLMEEIDEQELEQVSGAGKCYIAVRGGGCYISWRW